MPSLARHGPSELQQAVLDLIRQRIPIGHLVEHPARPSTVPGVDRITALTAFRVGVADTAKMSSADIEVEHARGIPLASGHGVFPEDENPMTKRIRGVLPRIFRKS